MYVEQSFFHDEIFQHGNYVLKKMKVIFKDCLPL
jgi:hypothetical protein